MLSAEFLANLAVEVELGRVRRIPHSNLPLSIYNYTEQTQFSKAFNEVNSMCRGLVISNEGEIVARPFKKFFNFEELGASSSEFSPDKISEIWTKEDGSLIVAFWWEGSWLTITRGSWASDQAIAAPNLLSKRFLCGANRAKTYLFELVGPSNINVVRNYEKDLLILLGAIDTNSAVESTADEIRAYGEIFGFSTPNLWKAREFSYDIIKNNINPNFEGVVLKNKWGERCKIKTDTYVQLHKMLTGLSESGIFKLWQDRMAAKLSMEGIPDEFFAEINQKMDAIDGRWVKYKESVFSEWEETKDLLNKGLSRKDIAVDHPRLRHVLSSAVQNIEPLSVAYDEFCKYNG
jgi:RNA ligase